MCVSLSHFTLLSAQGYPIGYWIGHRAIKYVYDAEDGLATPSHDHTAVKRLVDEHFQVLCLLLHCR